MALVDLDPEVPHSTTMPLMPRHDLLSVWTAAQQAGHEASVFVEYLNGAPLSSSAQLSSA